LREKFKLAHNYDNNKNNDGVKRMKIMIVDDDDSIREILKVMLKNCEIVEASDGLEAIEIYKQLRPDVILMDVMMPRVDGIEATKEILKLDPNAVVIGLTAFAKGKGKDLLKAGARRIIEKPFTRKKIIEIIEKLANPNSD